MEVKHQSFNELAKAIERKRQNNSRKPIRGIMGFLFYRTFIN